MQEGLCVVKAVHSNLSEKTDVIEHYCFPFTTQAHKKMVKYTVSALSVHFKRRLLPTQCMQLLPQTFSISNLAPYLALVTFTGPALFTTINDTHVYVGKPQEI